MLFLIVSPYHEWEETLQEAIAVSRRLENISGVDKSVSYLEKEYVAHKKMLLTCL